MRIIDNHALSDARSLGMIMWEMLAGQPPWARMSEAGILAAVRLQPCLVVAESPTVSVVSQHVMNIC
jgi:hypothetical protein